MHIPFARIPTSPTHRDDKEVEECCYTDGQSLQLEERWRHHAKLTNNSRQQGAADPRRPGEDGGQAPPGGHLRFFYLNTRTRLTDISCSIPFLFVFLTSFTAVPANQMDATGRHRGPAAVLFQASDFLYGWYS